MAKRTAAKRELINTGTDRRYVRLPVWQIQRVGRRGSLACQGSADEGENQDQTRSGRQRRSVNAPTRPAKLAGTSCVPALKNHAGSLGS